jgi:hypothetical protein
LWKKPDAKKYELIEGNHRVSAWKLSGKPKFLPCLLFIGTTQENYETTKFKQDKLWRDKAVDRLEQAGSKIHWARLDDEQFAEQIKIKTLRRSRRSLPMLKRKKRYLKSLLTF